MACLKQLKRDLEEVNKAFPTTHPVFRVDASVDELKCTFVVAPSRDGHERLLKVSATIPEEYPRSAPIWYVDDEGGCDDQDAAIASNLIEKLPRGTPNEQNVRTQVGALLSLLCSAYNVQAPAELRAITSDAAFSNCDSARAGNSNSHAAASSSKTGCQRNDLTTATPQAGDYRDGAEANENDGDDSDAASDSEAYAFANDDTDDDVAANDLSLLRNTDESKYNGTDDDYVGVDRRGVQLLEGLRHKQRDAHLHGECLLDLTCSILLKACLRLCVS